MRNGRDTLTMKCGENLGELLLGIAQDNIYKGCPDKAIEVYTEGLHGFTEELVIKLLKNEYVLITSEDQVSMELSDSKDVLEANRSNLYDWQHIVQKRIEEITDLVQTLKRIRMEFENKFYCNILNYDINSDISDFFGEELVKNVGVHNIAAKLIAGQGFAKGLASNGETIWMKLCEHCVNNNGKRYERALYAVVSYIDNIRLLHKQYLRLSDMSDFLISRSLVATPLMFADTMESCLKILVEFGSDTNGFHHALCDSEIHEYKQQVYCDISNTKYGSEYIRYHIIEKNIMDGYDAGWLSPDGQFYGDNGPVSSLIHLRLAEQIIGKRDNPESELEHKGWMKIHGNEVYGYFGLSSEVRRPTNVQIRMICDYADKYCNGIIHTRPQQIFMADHGISTYKLKQMDDIALQESFRI